MSASNGRRVVIVDLNNFAMYPTMAVGYLTSILRRAGMEVRVLSPLAYGVTGLVREPRATLLGHLSQQLRMATAHSGCRLVGAARRRIARMQERGRERRGGRVVEQLARELDAGAGVVLVSAYLMYHGLCRGIGEACAARGVPLVIGGGYLYNAEVARSWLDIPGLTAVVGGEVEPRLVELVEAAMDGGDLSGFAGVWQPDGRSGPPARPLEDLDAVPFPDYTDFPWRAYPRAIVPMITGRGCRWGACTFCSDVTSSAGRTFRSRSAENVLEEMKFQSGRHGSELFVFTDLKLNSNLQMWRSLLDGARRAVPRARWVGAVHPNAHGENGLTAEELRAARAAGMVRVTTGLESGSQRVLDAMKKGTDLRTSSAFLHAASEAGISVRTTMIVGYPGERADDVVASAEFLRRHRGVIDRVSLNRLAIVEGTPLHRRVQQGGATASVIVPLTVNHRTALVEHRNKAASGAGYRAAVARLVAEAHAINRRPLGAGAREFDGVM